MRETPLTRRRFLGAGATALAAFLAACSRGGRSRVLPSAAATSSPSGSLPSCVVTPAETEGPYFVDERLNRSDVREDRKGVPLTLTITVSNVNGSSCTPISGATVDVWHCDALGVYSDVSAQNSVGQRFLRGYQVTDDGGLVKFQTIYPGWYMGRTAHIHFKVRTTSGTEFTSQFFFDDSLSDRIYEESPYSGKGTRDTRNANDMVYNSPSTNTGAQLLLSPTKQGSDYAASFHVGLQAS
jgi:protocatechuate 3,4-dioxygenase beta subunit